MDVDLAALTWLVPASTPMRVEAGAVAISADAQTDWFVDPRGGAPTANAPLAVVPEHPVPVVLTARVRVVGEATFDAGALFLVHDERHWVKLALERSPQGRLMLVSVRTDGVSDDVNHRTVDEPVAWLRIAVDEHSIALHASTDGMVWHLLRYGARLASSSVPRLGLLAQSPTGAGMTATFSDVRLEARSIAELRDGS